MAARLPVRPRAAQYTPGADLDPFNQPQTDQLGQDYSALAGPPQFEECDPNATVEYQDTLTGPFLPNCDKLWIVERVWTVTDVCGNAASVTQEINFQDTLPPVVTLKVDPLTLKQSADANCEGVMPDILAMEGIWFNAEDICTPTPLLDLQQFPAAGTPLPLGPTTVQIIAIDQCNLTGILTFDILVNDTTPPTFNDLPGSLDKKIQCDESDGPANTGIPTVMDNCTPDININLTSRDTDKVGACPQQIEITRTWTAEDAAGNTSTFVQIITVSDDFAPMFVGPGGNQLPPGALNLTVECSAGLPPVVFPAVIDNCDPNPTVTVLDVANVNANGTGTINRTFTATDACGNSSQYLQVITVVDTTPPTIACPGNLVVSNDTGSCGAIVNFTVTADDDCDANPSVGCVPASGSFFDVGTTAVDCTATDRSGLSATPQLHRHGERRRRSDDRRLPGERQGQQGCRRVQCGLHLDRADRDRNRPGVIITRPVVRPTAGLPVA